MPDSAPMVSVITATRNRPAMLRRALESIRAQTFDNYEMVVADDGSEAQWRQEYLSIVEAFAPKIVFFHAREAGAPRSGPGAARNRAMERARGRYLAFLDDDDHWVDPDHLAIAVTSLETAHADYYFANMRQLRGTDVVIPDCFPNAPQLVEGPRVGAAPEVYRVSHPRFLATMQHYLVHPNIAVIRRDVAAAVGGFHEKVRFAEDYGFCMRVGDRAHAILYRPAYVAHVRLPEADSSSLWEAEFDHTLDWITVSQHVRATCIQASTERCARAREAWSMRELSRILLERGGRRAALSFATQGFCLYPTFGSAVAMVRTVMSQRKLGS